MPVIDGSSSPIELKTDYGQVDLSTLSFRDPGVSLFTALILPSINNPEIKPENSFRMLQGLMQKPLIIIDLGSSGQRAVGALVTYDSERGSESVFRLGKVSIKKNEDDSNTTLKLVEKGDCATLVNQIVGVYQGLRDRLTTSPTSELVPVFATKAVRDASDEFKVKLAGMLKDEGFVLVVVSEETEGELGRRAAGDLVGGRIDRSKTTFMEIGGGSAQLVNHEGRVVCNRSGGVRSSIPLEISDPHREEDVKAMTVVCDAVVAGFVPTPNLVIGGKLGGAFSGSDIVREGISSENKGPGWVLQRADTFEEKKALDEVYKKLVSTLKGKDREQIKKAWDIASAVTPHFGFENLVFVDTGFQTGAFCEVFNRQLRALASSPIERVARGVDNWKLENISGHYVTI